MKFLEGKYLTWNCWMGQIGFSKKLPSSWNSFENGMVLLTVWVDTVVIYIYSFSWLWNCSNSTSYLKSPLQQTCFIFLFPLKNVTRSLVSQNFKSCWQLHPSFPQHPTFAPEIEASRMLHVRLVGVDTQLGVDVCLVSCSWAIWGSTEAP